MTIGNIFKLTCNVFFIFLVSCASQTSIVNPNASIKSSYEEITAYDNDKSRVAKRLPKKIGNMELFNVVDYSKKYILGSDLGYGIFYDLKDNKKGSGNIFLYKRNEIRVEDGLLGNVLKELFAERRDIEKKENSDSMYSVVKYGNIEFYKMKFKTYPDKNNEVFDCYLFNTGYGGVYLKILFYYPNNSVYGSDETDLFMEGVSNSIEKQM